MWQHDGAEVVYLHSCTTGSKILNFKKSPEVNYSCRYMKPPKTWECSAVFQNKRRVCACRVSHFFVPVRWHNIILLCFSSSASLFHRAVCSRKARHCKYKYKINELRVTWKHGLCKTGTERDLMRRLTPAQTCSDPCCTISETVRLAMNPCRKICCFYDFITNSVHEIEAEDPAHALICYSVC